MTPPISSQSTLNAEQQRLLSSFRSPWRLRLFFLRRLPSLAWWGVGLQHLDARQCQVRIPFSWRTQNPFRSTYFAALAGAAELSTGLLVSLHTTGHGRFSLLVTAAEAHFTKKADTDVVFSCEEGREAAAAVSRALETGQPQQFSLTTQGRNAQGIPVAGMTFTWSIKLRG